MKRRIGLRVWWAVLAGSAADLAGLGLIAAAAWLITRAAEQPPLAALSVAIVATRAFATGKGVFRYAERLTGHDVALRAQAGTREDLYEALIPPQRPRHGGADLLSRMVDDTEAVQDLLVRCLLPAAAAAMAGLAAVVVGLTILPVAALVLEAGLVLAGVLLPAGTAAAARRWSARIAPARAALAGRVADLVHGSADLAAYGADDAALDRARAADGALAALERRQSRVHAAALAGGTLLQGLTVAAVVLLAQAAGVGSVGTAVLALTGLVAFEPVLPLAAAGERMAGITAALRRLREVRSAAPPPSPSPPPPRPARRPRSPSRSTTSWSATRRAGSGRRWTGCRCGSRRGGGWRSSGPAARARARCWPPSCAWPSPSRGASGSTAWTCASWRATTYGSS
ncbi:hypothetical protein GCM10020001_085890 [Nonomuraea salmonea]